MRVTSPRRQKHKKLLERAKGYRMARHKWYRVASEAVLHAGQYAFAGRHLRRRDLRSTWITRLNIALRNLGITYSKFIPALNKANITIDRKIMADLAVRQPEVLKSIAKTAGFTLDK